MSCSSDFNFVMNPLVKKLVNKLMLDGKRSKSEKIVFSAVDSCIDLLKNKKIDVKSDSITSSDIITKPYLLIQCIIEKVAPTVEVKSKRVGGANYQVPFPVSDVRRISLAMKWIVDAVRSRKEKTSSERLKKEVIDILDGSGNAIKKRNDVHKMAESNRAFAHFAKNF